MNLFGCRLQTIFISPNSHLERNQNEHFTQTWKITSEILIAKVSDKPLATITSSWYYKTFLEEI